MVTIIIAKPYNIHVTNTFIKSLPNPYNIPIAHPNTTATHTIITIIVNKSM